MTNFRTCANFREAFKRIVYYCVEKDHYEKRPQKIPYYLNYSNVISLVRHVFSFQCTFHNSCAYGRSVYGYSDIWWNMICGRHRQPWPWTILSPQPQKISTTIQPILSLISDLYFCMFQFLSRIIYRSTKLSYIIWVVQNRTIVWKLIYNLLVTSTFGIFKRDAIWFNL